MRRVPQAVVQPGHRPAFDVDEPENAGSSVEDACNFPALKIILPRGGAGPLSGAGAHVPICTQRASGINQRSPNVHVICAARLL